MTAVYIDPKRVKEIRKNNDCPLPEARRIAFLEAFDFAVDSATSVDDLKGAIKHLARLSFK
jgi:hypothetical protein